MNRESVVLREIEYCASHYGFFVMPRDCRPSDGSWSIWKEVNPDNYIGVLWRNNTGAMRRGKKLIRFGVVGLPDFSGWLFVSGRRVALEAKALKGRSTPDQLAHHELALETGVVVGIVHSYEECEELFKNYGLQRKVA